MNIQRYGWVPDLPDQRDHVYAAPAEFLTALPSKEDWRPECPPVYDQGQLGSCTGNAIAGAIEFEQIKQKSKSFIPSRLFIYYNERVIEHTVNSDNGAQIRDGMKVVAKQGAPPETEWPYVISKFADKPPAIAFEDGAKNKVLSYQRVSRILNQFKGCLASGYPFVFGFTVYDSFESAQVARTGIVPMPGPGERCRQDTQCWRWVMTINSSGSLHATPGVNWGMKGYFTIPYQYLLDDNLSDDFWTVRLVQVSPSTKPTTSKAKKKKH